MLTYIKGFVTLFVLLAVLIYLTPQNRYQKYIRFFTELILTAGILSPLLSLFGGNEKFLNQIAYEEFEAEFLETTKDLERMEYVHQDVYIQEYEEAIANDVVQIAKDYGFAAQRSTVHLGEDYSVEEITIWLAEAREKRIAVEPILLEDTRGMYRRSMRVWCRNCRIITRWIRRR